MRLKIIYIVGFWVLFASFADASLVIPLKGEIDFGRKSFQTEMKIGKDCVLDIVGEPKDSLTYRLSADVSHLPFGRSVLSTHLESLITRVPSEQGTLDLYHGQLSSQYTLFDFRPAREVTGTFQIQKNQVHIDSLSLGPAMLTGDVSLLWPFPYTAQLQFSALELDAFLSLWLKDKKTDFAGYVSGQMDFKGNLEGFRLGGRWLSQGVGFGNKYYDQMEINFLGNYPNMYIQNSFIVQEDGLKLAINGAYDLSKQHNYRAQIRSLNIEPVFTNNKQKLEWTLRSLKSEGQGRTELNYFRRKENDGGMLKDEDQGVIGIQRKLEF